MIQELQVHQQEVKDRIMKSFGYDNVEDYVENGMSTTEAIRKGIVEFDDEIEKAVYADTAENRKLGRVGQEYHRGRKKSGGAATEYDDDAHKDALDDAEYISSWHSHGGKVDGIKVGTKKDGKYWAADSERPGKGAWFTPKELSERAGNKRSFNRVDKLTAKNKRDFAVGSKFKDNKGREFEVTKHDSGAGRIRLTHVDDKGKKKHVYISGYTLSNKLSSKLTTGFPDIDKRLR